MIGSDLVRVVVFCALPFADERGAIVRLGGGRRVRDRVLPAGGLRGPAEPRHATRTSRSANALLQTVENIDLGGRAARRRRSRRRVGPGPRVLVNAATFVVSAALIARIPGRLLQQP